MSVNHNFVPCMFLKLAEITRLGRLPPLREQLEKTAEKPISPCIRLICGDLNKFDFSNKSFMIPAPFLYIPIMKELLCLFCSNQNVR